VLREELDRHVALETLIECELNRRHAADAQPPLDAISACDRGCACHWGFPLPVPEPPLPPVPPPPSPAPPLPLVVEVVPEPVGVVAVDVVVLVDVDVLVEVGVLVVEVVVEGVEVVEVVLVDELVVLLVVCWQSCAASCWTVEAPCSRFCVKVGLTDGGRFRTALLNVVTALAAALHCPELTAFAI
jgi:hypothetical protein